MGGTTRGSLLRTVLKTQTLGMEVAERRGSKRAKVALARKLHRMWIDGTTYRWAEAKPIAARA